MEDNIYPTLESSSSSSIGSSGNGITGFFGEIEDYLDTFPETPLSNSAVSVQSPQVSVTPLNTLKNRFPA
jgi:hypothetical protein